MKILLTEFQRYCLEHHINFVTYKFPGNKIPVTLFSSDIKIFKSISEINCDSGFLLSPFQSEDSPVIVIPDNEKVVGWEFELCKLPPPVDIKERDMGIGQNIFSYPKYVAQINGIKEKLLQGKAGKVVMSRLKLVQGIDYPDLTSAFEELIRHCPHAFVYLAYTPETGAWLGATPETLVKTDRDKFSTMALAGTKKFSGIIKQFMVGDVAMKTNKYIKASSALKCMRPKL